MLSSDLRAARAVQRQRIDAVQQQAEMQGLLREAGIEDRGWFSQQSCWLLCQMGRTLVAMGQRLEQRYRLPYPRPAEG